MQKTLKIYQECIEKLLNGERLPKNFIKYKSKFDLLQEGVLFLTAFHKDDIDHYNNATYYLNNNEYYLGTFYKGTNAYDNILSIIQDDYTGEIKPGMVIKSFEKLADNQIAFLPAKSYYIYVDKICEYATYNINTLLKTKISDHSYVRVFYEPKEKKDNWEQLDDYVYDVPTVVRHKSGKLYSINLTYELTNILGQDLYILINWAQHDGLDSYLQHYQRLININVYDENLQHVENKYSFKQLISILRSCYAGHGQIVYNNNQVENFESRFYFYKDNFNKNEARFIDLNKDLFIKNLLNMSSATRCRDIKKYEFVFMPQLIKFESENDVEHYLNQIKLVTLQLQLPYNQEEITKRVNDFSNKFRENKFNDFTSTLKAYLMESSIKVEKVYVNKIKVTDRLKSLYFNEFQLEYLNKSGNTVVDSLQEIINNFHGVEIVKNNYQRSYILPSFYESSSIINMLNDCIYQSRTLSPLFFTEQYIMLCLVTAYNLLVFNYFHDDNHKYYGRNGVIDNKRTQFKSALDNTSFIDFEIIENFQTRKPVFADYTKILTAVRNGLAHNSIKIRFSPSGNFKNTLLRFTNDENTYYVITCENFLKFFNQSIFFDKNYHQNVYTISNPHDLDEIVNWFNTNRRN